VNLLSLAAVACCLLTGCGGASGSGQPGAGSSDNPGIDELSSCDPEQPGFECLRRLFLPLAEHDWPFDADAVGRAWVPNAVFVLPAAKLTALHVIDAKLQQQPDVASHPPDCYAGEATFSPPGEILAKENCADFLFLGGSPTSLECQREGVGMWACTDRATVPDTFDIGLVAAEAGAGYLDVTAEAEVGEDVFLVGNPPFLLEAPGEQAQVASWFEHRYPVVSSGKVLAIDGGAIVVSNLAFPGNSGGPLLNRAAEYWASRQRKSAICAPREPPPTPLCPIIAPSSPASHRR
jgi:hypothetical protein